MLYYIELKNIIKYNVLENALDYIKNIDNLLYQYVVDYFGIRNNKITKHMEQFGSIIGKTNIINILDNSYSVWAMKDSYHWMLKNSSRISPIPCKGKLNIWEFNL